MIQYCDIHGHYDTDFHVEGCPRCAFEEEAAIEADRRFEEKRDATRKG